MGSTQEVKAYLLDTHVWLWSLLAPSKLNPATRRILEHPDAQLFLSPISVWEALLLGERGRILMKPNPNAWVRESLTAYPFQEAGLNREVALASRQLSLSHHDPADRFLAATAIVHGLVLITADKSLLKCKDIDSLSSAPS